MNSAVFALFDEEIFLVRSGGTQPGSLVGQMLNILFRTSINILRWSASNDEGGDDKCRQWSRVGQEL